MLRLARLAALRHPFTGRHVAGLIWALVAATALIAVAAVVTPWSFGLPALRDELSAQIRQTTGLYTVSEGRAVFALLPQPHIKIEQVSFADRSGALQVEAEYFKGRLRLLPLLVGRLEIASATLFRPQLKIDLDHRLIASDSAIGRAAEAPSSTIEAAVADAARLGSVTLLDGSAHIASKDLAKPLVVENINMTLDWPNLRAPASLGGKARIGDVSGDVLLWLAQPTEVLRGKDSDLTLGIRSDVLDLTANGVFSNGPKPKYAGHLHVSSKALPAVLDRIGYPIVRSGSIKNFRMDCDVDATSTTLSTANLSLRLAESHFEGSLAIERQAEKPLLSATLATDLLDLDSIVRPLSHDDAEAERGPAELVNLRALTAADLDIRISAARARLASFDFTESAFSLMAHADRLDLGLAEAKAYRGILKAKASIVLKDDAMDVHASASASDIDLGLLSGTSPALPHITGIGRGTAEVETNGGSLAQFDDHLDGRLHLNLSQGELKNISKALPSDAGAAETPPVPLTLPYAEAELGLKIKTDGLLVEQGFADAPGGHVLLSGTANLAKHDLSLQAVLLPEALEEIQSQDAASPNQPSSGAKDGLKPERFLITGPFDHPLITPAKP